jgi:lipopolysaccharide transport system ATP-binding protein
MTKIIEARNISKKYLISHLPSSAYSTLVETLSRKVKRLFSSKEKRTSQEEVFWALDEIDLDIMEGDRVGIIGRNGAGKSTLLKILSRIIAPTTGYIKISGRVSSLLEVGTGFHLELTGRENIFLNGAILGMSRQEIVRKFDEIVAFAEVEQFLDTPVKRFSSGMHMRLGFGIAAHLDPDVLIVDEVLSVGDMRFQEKCLKKLDDLSQRGRTVLFVSHDMGSVISLCNKGIFLEKGKIRTSGTIDHCVNEYMKMYRIHCASWKGNLGDENVRVYSVSIENGAEFFHQGEKIKVVVDYEVLHYVPDFILGFKIWNQRNRLLGVTQTWDNAQMAPLYMQKGRHKATFTLDTGLFHEGEYSIQFECFVHNKKQILLDEIALRMAIYPHPEHKKYINMASQEGIFLGRQWSID